MNKLFYYFKFKFIIHKILNRSKKNKEEEPEVPRKKKKFVSQFNFSSW